MIRTGGMFGFISGEFRKNLASLSNQFVDSFPLSPLWLLTEPNQSLEPTAP
jgi:hypothetical protein